MVDQMSYNTCHKHTLRISLDLAFLLFLAGTALFILKIANVVDWSWWIITLPFWIVPAFMSLVFLVYAVTIFSLILVAAYFMCCVDKVEQAPEEQRE